MSEINQETCKKCGNCIEICPAKIIKKVITENRVYIDDPMNVCIHCGQCMAICATESIVIDTLSYEENIFKTNHNEVDNEKFMDFIQTRRSTRNFKDKAVPKELLQNIIDSTLYTPFGADPEKLEITVVNDKEVINKSLPLMSKFFDKIVKMVDSPIINFFIKRRVDIETYKTLTEYLYPKAKSGMYKLENGDRITRGAPCFMIFHAPMDAKEHTNNAIINITYASLAAHANDLGATMIGLISSAINKDPAVRKAFNIPEKHEAILALIIGYPKYKFRKTIKRRRKVNWIGSFNK